ncbi:MAG: TetR/AcrR family transcriptional regulator [Thermoleophilaceae bacterium]|nr:TetR/AcrR family transcriptional regulator [Thermoleophilaceae bacterium]
MSTTPRKRLTGEERRAAILDSALEVFAERGYHASSIDDIAREGGVSKALIYEHFASKQELYAELLEQHAGELFGALAEAISEAGTTAAARLATGFDAFYGFVEEHRVAWRMLFREATDPEAMVVLDRVMAQVTTVVAGLIAEDPGSRRPVTGGETREQGIQVLAQLLVGAVQSLANWWAEHQELPRKRIVEMTMDFAWLGLQQLSRGERWPAPAQ